MVEDVIIEPMRDEFILWRCLHSGPLSLDLADQWPSDKAALSWRGQKRYFIVVVG
ncbi:hypothetical protein ACOBQJ_15750 [Pelotomaculum propionicicum]|uniref:hypothetical protein n=1 Tax=Pelotomaculum propionicicum TaxID=258475 RepID=UPI003B7DF8A1